MLPRTLTFVDVETTGASLRNSRIIEIGIIRVENDQVVDTFHSLLDPETHIPPEILEFTGITQDEIKNAPTFSQIKDTVMELFNDSVFVAHNVKFDYSFIKKEFVMLEEQFNAKTMCTVNLSRSLFPFYRKHNLDALIERHGISCVRRHRAIDDAKVLVEFYQKMLDEIPSEVLIRAFDKVMKNANIPTKIKSRVIEGLPDTPGIYVFYGKNGVPLYVGKSVNIKSRVKSHFAGSNITSKDFKLSQQIEDISFMKTAGELGALLKEAELVKELQPVYNSRLRNYQSLVLLKNVKNEEGYETVEIFETDNPTYNEVINSLGIFKSRSQAKKSLEEVRDKHDLCTKLLGLESTKGSCFLHKLEKCKGACVGKENPMKYNMRFYMAFSGTKLTQWPFKGPVVISEVDELNGKVERFLVNNWRVLKTVDEAVEELDDREENGMKAGIIADMQEDFMFDLDNYKIIKNFFRKKENLENIKRIGGFSQLEW